MKSAPDPFPTCPRCCSASLRFVASGDCSDSTGGGVYSCACGFSTARDLLVADLLRELREAKQLLEKFALMALPRLTRCRCRPDDLVTAGLRDLAEILGASDGRPVVARNGTAAADPEPCTAA